MNGTVLPALLAAYKQGNRRPRGLVIERLLWLAFEASRKANTKGIPVGGSACRVGRWWTKADYEDLVRSLCPGVTLADMARVQSRSVVGIVSRLQRMGLVNFLMQGGYRWNTRVMKRHLRVELAGSKNKHPLDLTPMFREMGWLETEQFFMLPAWLADKPVRQGAVERTPRQAVKIAPQPKTIDDLKDMGYYVVSRRHRMLARIDREDWREVMAKHHSPWDVNGEGMRWACMKGMGDYYRRCLSKDTIVIAPDKWDNVLRAIPNSGQGSDTYRE